MAFTQIIRVEGADEEALTDHVAAWDAQEAGVAPGYLGARLFSEGGGRHLIEVDFTSEEEARRNNDRPETEAWAEKLGQLTGDADYLDLRQVFSTYPEI